MLPWAYHTEGGTPIARTEYRPTLQGEEPGPSRDRQTAFERGVLLALIGTAAECVRRMRTLKEGGRWITSETDFDDLTVILRRLQDSILRAERIQGREE